MNKAFDRIEWDYLEIIFKNISFPARFNYLMNCVRSVPFSVLINGNPTEACNPIKVLSKGIFYPLTSFSYVQKALLQ